MDDYKIAFIHGNNFEKQGLADGMLELYGEMEKDSLHVVHLLEYATSHFPEISIFNQLTIKHQPEVVAFFLTKLGIAVFLNMTKYDETNLKRYGKMGMLMLPEELTEKQEETLKDFAKIISDYSISINYDLTIETGILDAKTIQGLNHETPAELLDMYFMRKNQKIEEKKTEHK